MDGNPADDCVQYHIEVSNGNVDVRDGEVMVVLDLGGQELPEHVAETIMQLASGAGVGGVEQALPPDLHTDTTVTTTTAFNVADEGKVGENHQITCGNPIVDFIQGPHVATTRVNDVAEVHVDGSMNNASCIDVIANTELETHTFEAQPGVTNERTCISFSMDTEKMPAQITQEQEENISLTTKRDTIVQKQRIEDELPGEMIPHNNIKMNVNEEQKSKLNLQIIGCDLCSYTTASEIDMGRHNLSFHGKEMPFKCFQCDKHFEKELSLHIHALSHEATSMTLARNGQLACPLCEFTCRLKQQMIDHFKKSHPCHEAFICSLCRFVCLSEEKLKEHNMFSQKHKMKRAKNSVCPICSLPCRNLKEHYASQHPEERLFLCTKCSHRSKTEGALKVHMVTHSKSKDFVCIKCNSAFKSRYRLKRHMRTHDPVKKFSCSQCDWSTNDKYDLKRHMARIHTKKPHHSCKQCNLTFQNITDLKLHAMDKHKSTHKMYCEYCEFSCESKFDFRVHMQEHSVTDSPNRFTCEICKFSSPWKCHYDRHMTIHSDSRPYACTVCSYTCKEKDNLKKHMVVHSDEKPFACKMCDYKCKLSNMLNKHMKVVHSEARPFHCTYCNYKAKTNGNLKKHLWIHEQQKPFKCTYCSYECREGSKLKRHISKKHKAASITASNSKSTEAVETAAPTETVLADGSNIRYVQVEIDNLSKPVLLDIGDSALPL